MFCWGKVMLASNVFPQQGEIGIKDVTFVVSMGQSCFGSQDAAITILMGKGVRWLQNVALIFLYREKVQ
jgi:hypothetical protein